MVFDRVRDQYALPGDRSTFRSIPNGNVENVRCRHCCQVDPTAS